MRMMVSLGAIFSQINKLIRHSGLMQNKISSCATAYEWCEEERKRGVGEERRGEEKIGEEERKREEKRTGEERRCFTYRSHYTSADIYWKVKEE